jgi:hypothetical protein
MMARRADETQGGAVFAAKDAGHGVARRSGGAEGDIVGLGAEDGIDLDPPAASMGEIANVANVLRGMDEGQSFERRGRAFGKPAASWELAAGKFAGNGGDAAGTFRVLARVVIDEAGIGIEERHGERVGRNLAEIRPGVVVER